MVVEGRLGGEVEGALLAVVDYHVGEGEGGYEAGEDCGGFGF